MGQGGQIEHHRTIHNAPPPPPPNRVSSIRERQKVDIAPDILGVQKDITRVFITLDMTIITLI